MKQIFMVQFATTNESFIYCYDELLGSEPSEDIYRMLKEWYSFLEDQEN